MRKGYWKALLSRLRGRVAEGNGAFVLDGFTFVLHEIAAPDDAALVDHTEILLALDRDGNALLINTATTEITIQLLAPASRLATGREFLAFIDGLQPEAVSVAEPMSLVDDEQLLQRIMRRKPSRGQGIFDDDPD